MSDYDMTEIKGSFKQIDYMEEDFKESIKEAGLENIENKEELLDLIAFWFSEGLQDH